jgi:hypothetical protein
MRNKIDFVETDLNDLSCHTGVTFEVDILLTDYCSGIPNNLSGYSAMMLVYDVLESEDIIGITGSIMEPEKGIINFHLSPTQTNTLDVGNYVHHIDISNNTNTYRICQGTFEVQE